MPPRLTEQDRFLRSYTEAQVQQTITDLLETFQWTWHHETDSRRSPEGFPDLMAVNSKTGWWVLLEVKKQTGVCSPTQIGWLNAAVGLPIFPSSHLICLENQKKLVGWVKPSTLDEWIAAIRRVS